LGPFPFVISLFGLVLVLFLIRGRSVLFFPASFVLFGKMVSLKSAALVALSLFSLTNAQRRNRGGRRGGNNGGATQTQQLTAQEQAAQVPDGISEATDGSTILDTTQTVK
jgi:hypothetical protein